LFRIIVVNVVFAAVAAAGAFVVLAVTLQGLPRDVNIVKL
jgi:hypothetical protein